jgi:hypothetical protein
MITFLVGFLIMCVIVLTIYGVGRVIFRLMEGDWIIDDPADHILVWLFGLLVSGVLLLIFGMSMSIGIGILN